MQPIQQQGRRLPPLRSARTLSTCWLLVSGVCTEITQQIHSLRASGVRLSHAASASESDVKALRKSAGTLCTTPPETRVLVMGSFYRIWHWLVDQGPIACGSYSWYIMLGLRQLSIRGTLPKGLLLRLEGPMRLQLTQRR